MRKLIESFSRLTPIQICNKIANGYIKGNWIDKIDIENAQNANEETANEILDEIDKSRNLNYNQWNQFN